MPTKRYPLGRPFSLPAALFTKAAGAPPRSRDLLPEYVTLSEYAASALADGLLYEASYQVELAEIHYGLSQLAPKVLDEDLLESIDGASPGDPRWPHLVRWAITQKLVRDGRRQFGWRGRSRHRWTLRTAFVVTERYREAKDGSDAVRSYLRDVASSALADLHAGLTPRPPVKQWMARINRATRRALSLAE